MTHISHAEWDAEIRRLKGLQLPGGLTAHEIAERSGWSCRKVQWLVAEGLKTGRYIRGFREARDATGRLIQIPVYAPSKPQEST